jgi:hypothetical protein
LKIFAWIALLACTAVNAAEMLDLRYQDSEGEGISYQTRILITGRYLRMDEGRDDGDFILFDRKTGKIVNVLHDRHMLMAMNDSKLPEPPPHAYRVEKKVTPMRDGTVRVQVLADGIMCSETVAAEKLFPDAARALREYKAALAYTQWATYRNTPAEMRQDCDLVHLVWQTSLALSRGLPLEERDYSGRVRKYMGGQKRALKPELFELPKGYELIRLPGVQGDGADNSSQPSAVQAR